MIVGSRWTSDQVRSAYEKADELLNFITVYQSEKPVHKSYAENTDFQVKLDACLTKNLPDEAVQSLSLGTLERLFSDGERVLKFAAYTYAQKPDIFWNKYASSKPAFFKDKFFRRPVPEFSFPLFKTGDNPALIQDDQLSRTCADLYHDSLLASHPDMEDYDLYHYTVWLHSAAGEKFFRETTALKKAFRHLRQEKLNGLFNPALSRDRTL